MSTLHTSIATPVRQIGEWAVRRDQVIPTSYLDELRAERDASSTTRAKEYHRVASIPVNLVELWLAQGFNVYTAEPDEIVKRLKAEGFDAFITSNKTVV